MNSLLTTVLLLCLCFCMNIAVAEEYILGLDSQRQDGVPQGAVTKHQWAESEVFPGTVRDYWVYVPKQYDAAKPACVMVFQDGGNYVNETDILIEGETWELIAEGFKYTEGPAVDASGNVYFTDVPNNKIYKISVEGTVAPFVEESHGTSGLIFGPNGKLYGCRRGLKQIVTYDDQGIATVIAEDVDGNDLVVNREGAIYFTEPSTHQIWYIAPTGEKRVVDQGIEKPNGIILCTD